METGVSVARQPLMPPAVPDRELPLGREDLLGGSLCDPAACRRDDTSSLAHWSTTLGSNFENVSQCATGSMPSVDSVLVEVGGHRHQVEEQPRAIEEVLEQHDERTANRPPPEQAPATTDGAVPAARGRPWWCDLAQGFGFIASGLVAGLFYLYFQSPEESFVTRIASLVCAILFVVFIGCGGARLIRFSPLSDDSPGSSRRARAAARQREAARRQRKIAKFPLRVVEEIDATWLQHHEVDSSASIISGDGRILGGDAQKACPVCLEDYANGDERRTLPCFHGFHRKCVDKWLMNNDVCPVCRHNVFDADLTTNEDR